MPLLPYIKLAGYCGEDMNTIDYFVLGGLIIAVTCIVVRMIRWKKQGKGRCCACREKQVCEGGVSMSYKPIIIDRRALTLMDVPFPDLETLENTAEAIGSNMFEGFHPTKKGIEIIRDLISCWRARQLYDDALIPEDQIRA